AEHPDARSWSVLEILHHLHLVESQIAKLVTRSATQARAAGLRAEDSTASMLTAMDRFAFQDRERKMEAPERVCPTGELSLPALRELLATSREAMRAALKEADGLALDQLQFPHPLLGALNLYQWILFVGHHEARHTAQITETLARLAPRAHAGGAGEL